MFVAAAGCADLLTCRTGQWRRTDLPRRQTLPRLSWTTSRTRISRPRLYRSCADTCPAHPETCCTPLATDTDAEISTTQNYHRSETITRDNHGAAEPDFKSRVQRPPTECTELDCHDGYRLKLFDLRHKTWFQYCA